MWGAIGAPVSVVFDCGVAPPRVAQPQRANSESTAEARSAMDAAIRENVAARHDPSIFVLRSERQGPPDGGGFFAFSTQTLSFNFVHASMSMLASSGVPLPPSTFLARSVRTFL